LTPEVGYSHEEWDCHAEGRGAILRQFLNA
jgi:hypothetical protein